MSEPATFAELYIKVEKLREEDERRHHEEGGTYFAEHKGKTTVTIYGEMTPDQRSRLLDLLIEIDRSTRKP